MGGLEHALPSIVGEAPSYSRRRECRTQKVNHLILFYPCLECKCPSTPHQGLCAAAHHSRRRRCQNPCNFGEWICMYIVHVLPSTWLVWRSVFIIYICTNINKPGGTMQKSEVNKQTFRSLEWWKTMVWSGLVWGTLYIYWHQCSKSIYIGINAILGMVTTDRPNKQPGEPKASLLVEHWAKQTFVTAGLLARQFNRRFNTQLNGTSS